MRRNQREVLVPSGKLNGTFEELFAAGCLQTGRDHLEDVEKAKEMHSAMFFGLQSLTGGNICNGCPQFAGGACEAFKKFHSSRISLNKPASGPAAPSRQRCPDCGMKIRGENHREHCKAKR